MNPFVNLPPNQNLPLCSHGDCVFPCLFVYQYVVSLCGWGKFVCMVGSAGPVIRQWLLLTVFWYEIFAFHPDDMLVSFFVCQSMYVDSPCH